MLMWPKIAATRSKLATPTRPQLSPPTISRITAIASRPFITVLLMDCLGLLCWTTRYNYVIIYSRERLNASKFYNISQLFYTHEDVQISLSSQYWESNNTELSSIDNKWLTEKASLQVCIIVHQRIYEFASCASKTSCQYKQKSVSCLCSSIKTKPHMLLS